MYSSCVNDTVYHPSTDNIAIKSTGKPTCLIENNSNGDQISLFLSLREINRWLLLGGNRKLLFTKSWGQSVLPDCSFGLYSNEEEILQWITFSSCCMSVLCLLFHLEWNWIQSDGWWKVRGAYSQLLLSDCYFCDKMAKEWNTGILEFSSGRVKCEGNSEKYWTSGTALWCEGSPAMNHFQRSCQLPRKQLQHSERFEGYTSFVPITYNHNSN